MNHQQNQLYIVYQLLSQLLLLQRLVHVVHKMKVYYVVQQVYMIQVHVIVMKVVVNMVIVVLINMNCVQAVIHHHILQ